MHCLACNDLLTDRETSRKYINWREMPEGEGRYILLCDNCLRDTEINFVDNPTSSDDSQSDGDFSDEGTDSSEEP